jgi:membrane protein implicated in regulation of membrane protease activity
MFLFVAIVVYIVLPYPWNDLAAAACLGAFLGEIFIWFLTVRKRHAKVGAQTLIGQQAVAIGDCRPKGQVRLRGEIWEARCEAGAAAGDTVVIRDRQGLTLIVEPAVTADMH